MIFEFKLTGTTPILFHADDVEANDRLQSWRKNPDHKKRSVPGDDRSPPWTWMSYLYSDGEYLSIPADVMMACIRSASAKITMKGMTSFKSTSQSGLFIADEFCEFHGPKGRVRMADLADFEGEDFATHLERVEEFGFRLFMKRAKIGQAKHVRVRARFEDWSVRGKIEIYDDIITPEILRKMFEIAGRQCGLLDWRPGSKESPGRFGTFKSEIKKVA